jgi:hypothetical protein
MRVNIVRTMLQAVEKVTSRVSVLSGESTHETEKTSLLDSAGEASCLTLTSTLSKLLVFRNFAQANSPHFTKCGGPHAVHP